MSRMKRKTLLLLVSMVGVVAVLGASLGMAVAGTTGLVSGFNLVGGPIGGDVPPASWVECITPATSWNAVYIWERKPGMLRMRDATKAAVMAVRGLGAREAKARLAEMVPVKKARKVRKAAKKAR